MEKKMYCHYCNEEHIVSETRDNKGVVVGLFCNREKALIISDTTKWNGESVYEEIRKFARKYVDLEAITRLKPEKVAGLGRKMAYQFLQTDYAKQRKINYYFATYHMTMVITRLRSEVRVILGRQ
jgi:hypothetical protein